jgi:hypothetical protein
MDLFFWLLLNLYVPITGPVSMLALVSFTHGYGVARQLIVESVRGGQLLWSSISLCAAGIYEAIIAMEMKGAKPVLELAITVYCFVACVSSILVMQMTVADHGERFSAQARRKGVSLVNSSSTPRHVVVSIGIVSFIVVVFASMHIYFT